MFYGKRLDQIEKRLSALEGRNAYANVGWEAYSAQKIEVKSVPEVWKVEWTAINAYQFDLGVSRARKEASFYSEEEAKDHAAVLEFAHEFIGNTYDLCVEIKKMQ